MPRTIDPDSFGFLVTDVSRLMRARMDRLIAAAGLGITPSEARTLIHAARAGAVRQGVLAERMAVEPMTLSGFLDRLEARGLIARGPDPADRRAKLVHLTDAADDVLERIRVLAAGVRDDAQSDLSADEWAVLQNLLKRVRVGLCNRAATPESEVA